MIRLKGKLVQEFTGKSRKPHTQINFKIVREGRTDEHKNQL